jgi:hypothetical protein
MNGRGRLDYFNSPEFEGIILEADFSGFTFLVKRKEIF